MITQATHYGDAVRLTFSGTLTISAGYVERYRVIEFIGTSTPIVQLSAITNPRLLGITNIIKNVGATSVVIKSGATTIGTLAVGHSAFLVYVATGQGWWMVRDRAINTSVAFVRQASRSNIAAITPVPFVEPTIVCKRAAYALSLCSDPTTIIYTNTRLYDYVDHYVGATHYVGKVVVLDGYAGCWTPIFWNQLAATDPVDVVVTATHADCSACSPCPSTLNLDIDGINAGISDAAFTGGGFYFECTPAPSVTPLVPMTQNGTPTPPTGCYFVTASGTSVCNHGLAVDLVVDYVVGVGWRIRYYIHTHTLTAWEFIKPGLSTDGPYGVYTVDPASIGTNAFGIIVGSTITASA